MTGPREKKAFCIDWPMSSIHGWGIYGRNLVKHAPLVSDYAALPLAPHDERHLMIDPLEAIAMRPAIETGAAFRQQIDAARAPKVDISVPLLTGMTTELLRHEAAGFGKRVDGRPTIGVVFMEFNIARPEAIAQAANDLALIIAGSTWNGQLLRAMGLPRIETVIQGVDLSLFHPAPRDGLFADRFVVFSGGKAETRKGQDLVLKAFRQFQTRHPDALLMTCWANQWPQSAMELNQMPGIAPWRPMEGGAIDFQAWARDNGIDPARYCDVGLVINQQMPRILREADVALFPNRGEGGTNLVAMEAMACGLPVILSANTGHLDLTDPDHCYPLEIQRPLAEPIKAGWGESDIDEIVDKLEQVYRDRAEARRRGANAARFMAGLSWPSQIRKLVEVIHRAVG